MTLALVVAAVVVLLVVLAVGAVVGDRAAARFAERKASEALTASFGPAASVRVHGTPFLTQALRGRYPQVEVVGAPRLGEIEGADLVGHLANVRLPLRDLVGRRVRELPCEHLSGRVVLPYDELARVARIPGLRLHFDGERLLASAALPIPDVPGLASLLLPVPVPTVSVPGLGQLARVSGEAELSLRGAGDVWLRMRGVTVAGIVLPSVVLNQLVPSLTVPIPLPPLPFGIRLDELRPTAAGLVVDGSADAVVFRAGQPAPEPIDAGSPSRPAPRPSNPTFRDERPEV